MSGKAKGRPRRWRSVRAMLVKAVAPGAAAPHPPRDAANQPSSVLTKSYRATARVPIHRIPARTLHRASERASEQASMRHAGEGVMAISPSERAGPGELKGTSSERASVFGPLELSPTAGKQP